jgi:hypothetical protein
MWRGQELEGNIYKYYWHPENIRYIKAQIIFAIENMEKENHAISGILRREPHKLDFLDNEIRKQTVLEQYELPLKSRLHNKNVEMIFRTSQQLYNEPSMISDIFDRLGDDGEPEYSNYGLSAYSFRGGQYHPEDIFMESVTNRKKKYWEPLDVEFNPWKRGPGNHWTDEVNPLPFNPYRVHNRFFAPVEKNCEDRRVNIPTRLPY